VTPCASCRPGPLLHSLLHVFGSSKDSRSVASPQERRPCCETLEGVFEPSPEWSATWSATVPELADGGSFDDGPGLFDFNAIIETFTGTFHTDPKVRATQRRIEDAGNLGPYLVEAMRRVSVHPRETPGALRFLDADTAELNLVVNLAGQRTPFVVAWPGTERTGLSHVKRC
jgi:hypothetical protein